MISPYHPLQLAFGLVLWLIWFSAIYGGMSVACAAAPPLAEQGPLTWINAAILLSTLVISIYLLYWSWKCLKAARAAAKQQTNRRFFAWVGCGVHLVGAIATLAVGSSALFFPPCV